MAFTVNPLFPINSLGKIFSLIVSAVFLFGCGGGYETVTKRGFVVKEWFLPLEGGKIEAYAVWPSGTKPRPALLLLHAAKGRAQRFRRTMFSLAKQGLITVSISLPGYGGSTGPDDYAGPRSVKATISAIDYLAGRGDVLENGVAIYGSGLGATTALLAAARSRSVRIIAVEGGVYDLEKGYKNLPPTERERLRFLLGGSALEKAAAYKLRSPIHSVGQQRSPILIIHSKDNRQFPLSEAENLAAALRDQGRPFRFIVTRKRLSEFNPKFPSLKKLVIPFMKDYLPSPWR